VHAPGGLGLREDPRTRLWPLAVRLAAGFPARTLASSFAASLASFERLPSGGGDFLRAQAVASLYVSYLATRDPRSLALLRDWRRGQPPLSELEALAALDARDTVAARAAIRSFPSADSIRAAHAPVSLPRWIARARAYEAIGDLRGAVAAYSVLEPRLISPLGQADPSWPFYARSLMWRGQLLERLGDRAGAIDAYRRFVSLWAEADPALQPQRESARAGLRRLGAAS
jgi:tetratricopeptide (TPR) repeat protein